MVIGGAGAKVANDTKQHGGQENNQASDTFFAAALFGHQGSVWFVELDHFGWLQLLRWLHQAISWTIGQVDGVAVSLFLALVLIWNVVNFLAHCFLVCL